METGGLWFLYHKLVIPPDRLDACFWVFQLSLLTTVISITQVPYTSLVSSHENFDIYAYISIFEALAKLGICYVLFITSYDKLIVYATLIAFIQMLVAMAYRIYCMKQYNEAHLKLIFNRTVFKGLIGFSGWNVMANLTEMLKLQGVVIIINHCCPV